MEKILIRKATKNDDFKQMAELIYITDIYIFPYWFSSKQEGIKTLAEMIACEDTMFSYKNCLVAERDGNIVGIINYFDKNSKINNDYSKWNTTKEFEYVLLHHLRPLDSYQKGNIVYLSYLSVLPEFRRHKVATKMLEKIFSMYQNVEFTLYCVKDNLPAFNLYTKCGFEYKKDDIGFNGPNMERPIISKMVKKKD